MRQQSQINQFGQGAQTTDERLLRAAANGQFLDEPPQPAPDAPGWRSDSTGRFVGYEIDEHQATRSTSTGRIKSLSAAEPVTKQEQTSRWGNPDVGGNISERRAAKMDALYENEPMSADEELTARAASADVSLSPDEALRGVGSGGVATATEGDVPVTDRFGRYDKDAQEEDRELRELSAQQESQPDPFKLGADVGGSVELFGGGSDGSDVTPAGEAVMEFNDGNMGLRELGTEIENRASGDRR